jgi:hypothetical protein
MYGSFIPVLMIFLQAEKLFKLAEVVCWCDIERFAVGGFGSIVRVTFCRRSSKKATGLRKRERFKLCFLHEALWTFNISKSRVLKPLVFPRPCLPVIETIGLPG